MLALTVAQPFGLIAHEQTAAPAGARPVHGATSVHVARVLGLPILPFVVYRWDYLMATELDSPSAALRARSWFWLPILTSSTYVAQMCEGGAYDPCWDPSHPSAGQQLTVLSAGGHYYVKLTFPGGQQVWELGIGIASILGLLYWELLAVLIPLVLRARRRARRAVSDSTESRWRANRSIMLGWCLAALLAVVGLEHGSMAPVILLAGMAYPVALGLFKPRDRHPPSGSV